MLSNSRTSTNHWALKEWDVVCAAVASGRQRVLLRKGGIDEGPAGFSVQHAEFWLFPTRFHQSTDQLLPEALPLLETLHRDHSTLDETHVPISLFARVTQVERVTEISELAQFEQQHILSKETVQSRFRYRDPGLFVLHLQVSALPASALIPNLARYAGCHSWVELDDNPLLLPPD